VATEHPKITAYIPKEILQALDNWKQSNDIKSRSEAIVRILENYLEVPHKVPQQGTANLEAALSAVLKELGQLHERVATLEKSASTVSLAVPSTALTNSSDIDMGNVLGEASSTALAEATELSEEAPSTVLSTATPNSLESQPLAPLPTTSHESNSSNVLFEVPSTAPTNSGDVDTGNVLNEAVSTALVEGTGLPGDATSTASGTALNPLAPLTQSALAKRLGCSDKAVEKHRKQGDKEGFASWSRERDPNNLAWTWEGTGGRGQPLRFLPRDFA
jgi:metal-responsive CopG/Arc/MetJ family transcriptional regulator